MAVSAKGALSLARRILAGLGLALAAQGLAATTAEAVPSYAIQTGQPCEACHVGGFGPQLTPFGRNFKINGYTSRSGGFTLPVSAMLVASYVSTAKGQPGGPAPGYGANDNATIDQISLFLAGGAGHFGAFVQTTYDGVAKAWHWDNLDLRAVAKTTIKRMNAVFGLSFNNAPTVQDPFNTLAGWGFPYTTSSLAPSGGASPLIGGFAQTTLGITAYAWLDDQFYLEAGGYQSPGASFLTHLGVDPTDPGAISGTAPYLRLAWQKNFGSRNLEVGAFLLDAHLFPGLDQSTGLTDHYTDIGLDASYQWFMSHDDVLTVNARYVHERQNLLASQALDSAANASQTVEELRVDASYYWRDKVGLTLGAFDNWGTADPLLYMSNAAMRPDTAGLLVQLDGTPWGAGGSPLGPRFNLRVGIQYTDYFDFDGSAHNYDTFGRNAGDNNTVRLFAWVAY
jgi:hypothetical protein